MRAVTAQLVSLLLLGEVSTLEWDAPMACPSAVEFLSAITGYLGRGAVMESSESGALELAVHIDDASVSGWRLLLELRGTELGEVRHELVGFDCRELSARAAALTATTLDPFALGWAPRELALVPISVEPVELETAIVVAPPESTPGAERGADPRELAEAPEAKQEPARLADEVTRPSSRSSPPLMGFASASLGLGFNLFESANATVQAQLGAERGLLRASVYGGVEPGGRFRTAEDPAAGGDLIAWSLGLRGCVAPRWNRAQLRGCAAAGAGQMRGRGVGVQDPQTIRLAWIYVAPELGFAWSLTPQLALSLDLGLRIALRRPRFEVEEPDGDYVVPTISGRGLLGLELRFPRRRLERP